MALVIDCNAELVGAVVVQRRRISDAALDRLRDRGLRAGERQHAIAAVLAIDDGQARHIADRAERSMRNT